MLLICPFLVQWHAMICGFWSSAEACNGVWERQLWAVAKHLADVLWSLLDTLSTSL